MEKEDLRDVVTSLVKRIDALEKLVTTVLRSKGEVAQMNSIKYSRKMVAIGAGTFLWDWFQQVDDHIVSHLQALENPATFKQDTLCLTLVRPELLTEIADQVARTPSLADHWEFVNIYPLSLGRFIPMIPATQCNNGMRIIYERIYHFLYNRARALVPKMTFDDEVIDLTDESSQAPEKKVDPYADLPPLVAVKPEFEEKASLSGQRSFTPPVVVARPSGGVDLVPKGPTLPALLPVSNLQKVSEPATKPPPPSPPRKSRKKRPTVSPLKLPDSPIKRSQKKSKTAPRKGRARRTLFQKDTTALKEEPEESSSSEEELPTKRAHKPSKNLLESLQQASLSLEDTEDTEDTEDKKDKKDKDDDNNSDTEPTDLQAVLQTYLSFSPSTAQIKSKAYQFSSNEMPKALRPLRGKASTPGDVFVALSTTVEERHRRAPLVPLNMRGGTEARKKLAVYSFQFFPGLAIVKGVADPLLPFKLHFDAQICFPVQRSIIELETVFWKHFLVANALLWVTVGSEKRIVECLSALKLDLPQVLPTDQKVLATLFESLPTHSWDALLDEMVLDFSSTDNLESPLAAPKSAAEAGKCLLHPYMWSTARNVKTGVVLCPNTISGGKTTPKQASLRLSLLLWSLFPQPTEIPSILAHWVSLYLGLPLTEVRLQPVTRSPLWNMFWDLV